jgi:hypothetical protein
MKSRLWKAVSGKVLPGIKFDITVARNLGCLELLLLPPRIRLLLPKLIVLEG